MERKDNQRGKLELLAPGGSPESMRAAVNAGADAIYMGGRLFSARAYALNADGQELLSAIDYCHIHGRKLYLTVNTLLKERELEKELYEYLLGPYEHGLDGVLVQDLGVFRFIRRNFPDLPIHASTQMAVMGAEGAKLLERMGAVRVVPARELSLEEIREIRGRTNLEIECFVHGALCYCYSGQCLMSSLIGGRSGNRGRCAQPCRMTYDLYEKGKKLNRGRERYLLSLKDICTLKLLPGLAEAGVCSFKIEGRMKRAEYASGVTRIYRKYIDRYLESGRKGYRVEERDVRELMDLYNRGGFSQGYYKTYHGKSMMSMERPNHQGTPAARVLSAGGNRMKVQVLEDLEPGDVLEAESRIREQKETSGLTVKTAASRGSVIELERASGCGKGELLVRVRSKRLLDELQDQYGKTEIQEKIKGNFILRREKEAILTVSWQGEEGEISWETAGAPPQLAQKQPIDQETIRRCLSQTGGTPFAFSSLEIQLEDGLFYPVQQLKELRRRALEGLARSMLVSRRREKKTPPVYLPSGNRERERMEKMPLLTASVETMEQLGAAASEKGIAGIYLDCCIFLPFGEENQKDVSRAKESFLEAVRLVHGNGKRCYLMLPQVWRSHVLRAFRAVFDEETLQAVDGFLLRSGDQLRTSVSFPDGKERIADAGIYTYNREARQFLREQGITMDTLPLECNRGELFARGCRGSECIVYGRLPLMVTAQCLACNTEGCRHRPDVLWLEDRKKMAFPVKTVCSICTNVIYNSVPLDLISCAEEVLALEPVSCRLMFTVENSAEVKKIVDAARKGFFEGNRSGTALPGSTRGHFKRGVE